LTVNGALASATLSLANDFTGATTLTAGTLQLQNAGSVAGSAVALNGGTLQLRNNAATAFTTASTTIGGNTTIDVDRLSSGSNLQHSLGATSIGAFTLNITGANGYSLALGATTLTGAATFNPTSANVAVASVTAVDQNLTLDGTSLGSTVGAITTGLGTLTKSNTSTWTLNADNTYTGATAINGGTLGGCRGRRQAQWHDQHHPRSHRRAQRSTIRLPITSETASSARRSPPPAAGSPSPTMRLR